MRKENNMTEEKLKIAIDYLKQISQLTVPKEKLEAMAQWTSERSCGNYDDCFDDGCSNMAAYIALDARHVLEQITPAEAY